MKTVPVFSNTFRRAIQESLLLASFSLFAACCKDNPPQADIPITPPKQKIYVCTEDLPLGEMGFPSESKKTYDPRGVYCVNTPFVRFTNGYSPTPFYPRFTPTSNAGSGRLIIEGADSTKGTWRTENLKLDLKGVQGFMDYNKPPTYTFAFGPVNGEDFQDFLAPGGIWENIQPSGFSVPVALNCYNTNGRYTALWYYAYGNQIVFNFHSEVGAAGLIRGDKLWCDYYLCFKRAVEQ